MKYFTKNWHFGGLKDYEADKVLKNYCTYIDEIYDQLPFVLKLLVKDINLHDGILRKTTYFSKENILILEGIFGDLQLGYFILKIKYLNLENFDDHLFKSICMDKFIEILSDEIGIISDNKYCHRMFFSNKEEIQINFSNVELEIINAFSRDYKKQKCFYSTC